MEREREFHFQELDETSPMYSKHIDSRTVLKPHQRAVIEKCIQLENVGMDISVNEELVDKFSSAKTNIGILADKCGSGKSYSILGVILCNPVPLVKFNTTFVMGQQNIVVQLNEKSYANSLNLNVIVCSFGLINQWQKLIRLFSNTFRLFVINKRKLFEEFKTTFKNYNILLVSGSFYHDVASFLVNKNASVLRTVFDEVDSVSTPKALPIPSSFYWLMSASYKNIIYPRERRYYTNLYTSTVISPGIQQNIFIRNIFIALQRMVNRVDVMCIDQIIVRCKDSFVDKSFTLQEPMKNVIVCQNIMEINMLEGITNSNVIQCLNAGDVTSAISFLQKGKVGSEDTIISSVKNSLEISLQNAKIKLEYTKDMIFHSEEQRDSKLKMIQDEVCGFESKLNLLNERITKNDICVICLNSFDKKSITSCCKNSFCFACICKWINTNPTCPVCKSSLSILNDLYVIDNDTVSQDDDVHEIAQNLDKHARFKLLIRQIYERNSQSKVLIFSEYDNSFYKIDRILSDERLSYAYVKGVGINTIINKFKNSNETNILLVNSKSFGSGLNLENTTDVILFHKFDSQIEKQVIGRAQRPGRTSILNIHYLLYENEI
jgi:hypothetical protein